VHKPEIFVRVVRICCLPVLMRDNVVGCVDEKNTDDCPLQV
jgi:hypothetical protein